MKQAFRLTVRVMPQGGKDKLESIQVSPSGEMFLKLQVKAAPEAGKANIAVIILLASLLDVPPSAISLLKGHKVRLKIFSVQGDSEILRGRLLECLEKVYKSGG